MLRLYGSFEVKMENKLKMMQLHFQCCVCMNSNLLAKEPKSPLEMLKMYTVFCRVSAHGPFVGKDAKEWVGCKRVGWAIIRMI